MAWCRHILASVEVPAVTQARGSGDYRAGNMLWQRLGLTSLLLHAVGLGCSKDTFWTSAVQPGNKWGAGTVEPNARLQAAVATISKGPVAPSDAIGKSDARLIRRSATAEGRLLQPGEPASALDIAILATARGRPLGDVWFGATVVSGRRFGVLFAARVPRSLRLTAADLGYPPLGEPAHDERAEPTSLLAMDSGCDVKSDQACSTFIGLPELKRCGTSDFQLFGIAPREPNGHWTFLGEVNKVCIEGSNSTLTPLAMRPTPLIGFSRGAVDRGQPRAHPLDCRRRQGHRPGGAHRSRAWPSRRAGDAGVRATTGRGITRAALSDPSARAHLHHRIARGGTRALLARPRAAPSASPRQRGMPLRGGRMKS